MGRRVMLVGEMSKMLLRLGRSLIQIGVHRREGDVAPERRGLVPWCLQRLLRGRRKHAGPASARARRNRADELAQYSSCGFMKRRCALHGPEK